MLILESAAFQNSLGSLAVVTYQPGETVIVDGSKTGRLLILKKGTVTIEKEGTEIAKVTEPGAIFGELSVLLDQPHAANVRALESSQFHVANANKIQWRCSMWPLCWPIGSRMPITLLFN